MLQSSLSDASTATSKRSLASLADQIWDSLRTAIIRGDLAPGERLIELKIAEQMGASQGPAHETLQCLEYEGLVKRRARSSSCVTPISNNDMVEMFSIHNMVEGFAISHTIANGVSAA
jgi:DNA-binding GntR family transcriptional regulator